jgi:hypothetical protein
MLNPSAMVMLVVGCVALIGGLAYFLWVALHSKRKWED